MEDDNDILTEDDIVKYISLNGVISDTTALIVYAGNLFGKEKFKENQFQNHNWGTGST